MTPHDYLAVFAENKECSFSDLGTIATKSALITSEFENSKTVIEAAVVIKVTAKSSMTRIKLSVIFNAFLSCCKKRSSKLAFFKDKV